MLTRPFRTSRGEHTRAIGWNVRAARSSMESTSPTCGKAAGPASA